MKTAMKKAAVLLCCLCLVLAMTGCERADYVAAVEVYNSGDFAQARELFLALEDYEDSAALAKRCEYHLAVALYSDGAFQEAITALEKLGDYEDSLALITHSRYQIALQLKESKDYDAAEAAFEALDGYANSADHIADIRWARLYDTVLEKGTLQEDGTTCRYAPSEESASWLQISTEDPYTLTFSTEATRDEGFLLFDSLAITLRYPVTQAEYSAVSKFILQWNGAEYGSTQTCSGAIDPAELNGDTVLKVENYRKESLDIRDESHSSADASDSSMEEGMAANLKVLLADIPVILQSLDSRFTTALLGFTQLA